MALTYSDHIKKDVSEKNIIAWVEPAQRLFEWTLSSGSVYCKQVDFYLIDLKIDSTSMESVDSLAAIDAEGKYFFDGSTKNVYFWASGSVNPSTINAIGFYRIAFADYPAILPIDNDLKEIEYLPLIKSRSRFSHKLDHKDQIGVALTSTSSINFIYEDFWINYYDRLEWANKRCRIWSYSPRLPFEEKQIYFDGIIEDRTISVQSSSSGDTVTLRVKDFLETLKQKVPLDLYSSSDGELPDSIVGTSKRRVYGRVSGLRVVSTNQILDGFEISGDWTGALGGNTFTGVGGNALDELSFEDKIFFGDNDYKVESIPDDNTIVISETIEFPVFNDKLKAKPEIQSIRTGRNTIHQISDGHALREASTTVVESIQFNRISVVDATDIEAGDLITIGTTPRTVRRVSVNNVITLTQSLTTSAAPGTIVTKNPVQKVFANGDELQIDRDYSVTNTSAGSFLNIDPLAEFNVAVPVFIGQMSFTNGSDQVTSSNIEFKSGVKVRDWIKPKDPDYSNWYEVLAINEDTNVITLRGDFLDPTINDETLIRRISPIGDNTIITVDCFGKTDDNEKTGNFLRTGSDVVKDLLLEAGLSDILDNDSYDLADKTAPQLISLPIPESFSSQSPSIGDVIKLVNQSIFGSIHYTSEFKIAYNVLTAEKPNILPSQRITDSDVVTWSAQSTTKNIVQKVAGQYRFQDADRFTGRSAFSTTEHESDYAKYVVQTNKSKTIKLYLYNERDAKTMVERTNFINDTSQSIIRIQTKLKFALFNINDKLMIDFDRLYARFGSIGAGDSRKIGIISGIDKSPDGITLTVDDLGNIWNRVANITEDDAVEFTLSGDEKIINGYITDNNELIDNTQDTYRLNLIG